MAATPAKKPTYPAGKKAPSIRVKKAPGVPHPAPITSKAAPKFGSAAWKKLHGMA